MDYSRSGSSVHGIFQARILEWVAISLFRVIFLTQGSHPRPPHWQVGSLLLAPPGNPRCVLQHSRKCPLVLTTSSNGERHHGKTWGVASRVSSQGSLERDRWLRFQSWASLCPADSVLDALTGNSRCPQRELSLSPPAFFKWGTNLGEGFVFH